MESQPQNPEFRITLENVHPCTLLDLVNAQVSKCTHYVHYG